MATNGGDLNFNNFINNSTGSINILFGRPNFKISGNFTNNNPNLNVENSFFYFNGSSLQTITGLQKVYSFALNNPSGAILNSKLELGIGSNQNGGLVLLNGKLDTSTASNDITISYIQTCTQGNNFFYRNAGSWVTGKFLQKFNYNESGNCTFPVGTSFNYSPIILTSNPWPAPQNGLVIVQAFHGEHPDTLSNLSGINSAANINKYWTISSPDNPLLFQNSLFSINATICSSISGADCTISDLDTSLNFNNLIARYKTTTWSDVNISNKTSTNVTINNLTTLGTLVLGEFKALFTSASNYAVLEPSSLSTWSASARKPLFTKISGIPFTLDVAALKTDGTIADSFVTSSNPSKTVQLELFNFNPATSCSAYSSPIASQNITFTTTNSHYYSGRVTSSSFTVNSAHKEVIARITDSSVTPSIQSCSTDIFTIRPSQLLLLNTSANGDSLGVNSSSSVIIPTGNSFSMTVGTNTIGYNGMPSINATKMNWNNLPSGGQIGVLTGSFSAANVTNGNDSIGNNFTYSEVGYFNFLAQGIYDENFISSNDVNNGDCTLNYSNTLSSDKYGCYFGNINPTSYIGRFVPSTFKFLSPSITNRVESSCTPTSNFTYLAEPLSLSTTIQALNQNNQIVKNYSGNFNRFDNFSFNLRANISSLNLTSKINLISQTGSFVNGVNNYVTKFSLNRDANPTNPYFNTVISSAFSDLDNIKSSPINNDVNLDSVLDSTSLGITNFYFGRLRLSNNKGSDLLPLKIDLFTEYFDNNSFKIMTFDNCTTLNSHRFSTSNFVGDLSSNEISFTYLSPIKMGNGMLSILMNKPSGGDGNYAGTFEFNYDLLSDNKPYLQSQWVGTSSYSQNPKSQITISKKSGNPKFLFIKELF